MPPIKLSCVAQQYHWGKHGSASEVARLMAANGVQIDEGKPYAELWMCTHPKGPSTLSGTTQPLSAALAQHPEWLGAKLSGDLPFLFKVLSVDQALSIQVHPTKEMGAEFHKADPTNYPDPNHKPEMAIALTLFEMLCGFKPMPEIAAIIQALPEVLQLITETDRKKLQNSTGEDKALLRSVFSSVMKQPTDSIKQASDALTDRLKNGKAITGLPSDLPELITRLSQIYPSDMGLLATLFLNHFTLQPGEAVFLDACEPHAYLSGNCIECMACSDNTIRAGLTPKFKDVDRLCEMLTYRTGTPDDNRMTPKELGCGVTDYTPPAHIDDFAVRGLKATAPVDSYTVPVLATCSIVVVVAGAATSKDSSSANLHYGSVHFLPADCELKLKIESAPFQAYQAYSPCGV